MADPQPTDEAGFDFGRAPYVAALVGAAIGLIGVLVMGEQIPSVLSMVVDHPLGRMVEGVVAGGTTGYLFGLILALGYIGE